MFLRMIYDDKLAAAAYLIGCQKTGEAIVIDPQRDVDRYEALAAANGLRIVAATETHIHADFLSGTRELAAKGAMVYLSDEGDADWKYQWVGPASGNTYQYRLLKNNDTFRIGNIEFQAVHTPGHTPEHLCFRVTDRGGGADRPMGVLSGDFVFVGDLGRPDLLESAAGIAGKADPSAHRLYSSVQNFLSWPDYLQVWPGHGAGSACGKALGAVPQTTVGYEKLYNPAIRAAASEGAFVRSILEAQPEPPVYFARMKRENKLGPRVLGRVPVPKRLSPTEFASIDPTRVAVIDTRPWAAYRDGHPRGAMWLPLNNSFSTDAGSLLSEEETIVLMTTPGLVDEAVRGLIRIGLDRISGWFDVADLAEAQRVGLTLEKTNEVDATAAAALVRAGSHFLLDVRRSSEFQEGAIRGALNISHTRLRSRLDEIPRGKPVLVNCRSGVRSGRSVSLLQRLGYDVVNLEGGYLAWEKAAAANPAMLH